MNSVDCIPKPFVKWVGGKGKLLPEIDKALPPDMDRITTYVEPFVCGGSVMFHMLRKYPKLNKIVVNDMNMDLCLCYATIKNNPKEVVERLEEYSERFIPIDTEGRKELYYGEREKFNKVKSGELPATAEESCARFIFLNKTCFNGLYRVNSKGLMNTPMGSYTNPTICVPETIYADSEALQNVEILNGDFHDTITHIGKGTLVYMDPPYLPLTETSSFTGYQKDRFTENEQVRLKQFCDEITERGGLFIESNSDPSQVGNPFMDNLYSSYSIKRIMAGRAINCDGQKRGKVSELLISNF